MTQRAYLAVCSMFKDEGPYLAEWIEFHRFMGVERFFLYDNLSSDSGRDVLEPLVSAGVVSLVECSIPFERGAQAWIYADALERARGDTRWLAYLDIDEFLFSPQDGSLADVLSGYERHPGVIVNWQVYGSGGLDAKPPGLVIESFTRRARTNWVRNRRVKSIVDPVRARRCLGPHFFEYKDGALAVTENHEQARIVKTRSWVRRLKRPVQNLPVVQVDPYAVHRSSIKRVSVRRLRINHYVIKSRQEFATKMARFYPPPGSEKRRSRISPAYFAYHDRNEVHDPILHRFVPEVKRRMDEVR